LRYAFMSMALNYNLCTNMTCGYLGFQANAQISQELAARPSPGQQLLVRLRLLKDNAGDPMLRPALAAGLWMEYLHDQNHQSSKMLREIQNDIGLMSSYLQIQRKFIKQPMKLDEVHQKIVSQHAFLTNGMSEFVTDLFPSTEKAMHVLRELRCPQR
jgi:hypothetical protein